MGGNRERESMDATGILSRFQDYDFGTVEIDELHLSQRRAAREGVLHQLNLDL